MPFKIIRNDITKVNADMIVNTANPKVAVGPGVDHAIYKAAGFEKLFAERKKIGEMKAGDVKLTPAFDLSAKYIAHVSGPVWTGGRNKEAELLRNCYDSCLFLAGKHRCSSIAFPLMSAGNNGFPAEISMQIAVDSFRDFLADHEMDITLVVFESHAYKISGTLFEHVQSFIDDRYAGRNIFKDYEESADLAENVFYEESCDSEVNGKPFFNPSPGTVQERPLFYAGGSGRKSAKRSPGLSLSLDDLLKKMYTDSLEKHLKKLINKKGLKNSEVYSAANISKQYFSKLMKGQVRPSKEKMLALAVGLRLNKDETIDSLKLAGYALSPLSQTDIIVEYFIEHENYDVMKIDYVLFDYGLPQLSERN